MAAFLVSSDIFKDTASQYLLERYNEPTILAASVKTIRIYEFQLRSGVGFISKRRSNKDPQYSRSSVAIFNNPMSPGL